MSIWAVFIIVKRPQSTEARWIDSQWVSEDLAKNRRREVAESMSGFGISPDGTAWKDTIFVFVRELTLTGAEMAVRSVDGKFKRKEA